MKQAAKQTSEHGLGYDVVMTLLGPYLDQVYHLYLRNFYTSTQLLIQLFMHGTPAVGTAKLQRKGFPACLQNAKS